MGHDPGQGPGLTVGRARVNTQNLTKANVLRYVRAYPGATCANMADAFGTSAARVGVELRELRAECRIESKGNTQGTRYFPA